MASHTGLPFINVFLKDILYIYVNGGYNGPSIYCRLYHTFQIGIFIQIAILSSVYTDQAVIIILLNAAGTIAAVPRLQNRSHCRQWNHMDRSFGIHPQTIRR